MHTKLNELSDVRDVLIIEKDQISLQKTFKTYQNSFFRVHLTGPNFKLRLPENDASNFWKSIQLYCPPMLAKFHLH